MQEETKRSKAKSIAIIFWLIVTIIPIVGIVLAAFQPAVFNVAQEEVRSFVGKAGVFGPLVFIAIQAIQVIVAPISHYSIGYMGGVMYGVVGGTFYNWIGRVLGHCGAFLLGRKLGRPLVNRFVPESTMNKYDKLFSEKSVPLFFIYFLPLFPDDEISYLASLTKMKFRWFLAANLFGHVGGSMGLAYLGAGVTSKDWIFWTLMATTLLTFPALWIVLRKHKRNE